MYKILRWILFRFDPEFIHDFVVNVLRLPLISKLLGLCYRVEHPSLHRQVFGIDFKNPVGLAAGFDKNGQIISQMADIGFGFVEIGTITPKPQDGNPKPRLFRLPADNALINRMGFNNDGVYEIVQRLRKGNSGIVIGGNIGKNKLTPNEQATRDYEICFNQLYPHVDFFVINVSSPNTPQLRELQEKEPLTKLLRYLKDLNHLKPQPKPILLKIAPDLSFSQLDDIIQIIQETKINGIIATNTTIDRKDIKTPVDVIEKIADGGLSGKPLASRSTEIIRYIHEISAGNIPIIGVGGIHSVNDALEKFDAGASLVELYTGFIYEGPGLIKKINSALIQNN